MDRILQSAHKNSHSLLLVSLSLPPSLPPSSFPMGRVMAAALLLFLWFMPLCYGEEEEALQLQQQDLEEMCVGVLQMSHAQIRHIRDHVSVECSTACGRLQKNSIMACHALCESGFNVFVEQLSGEVRDWCHERISEIFPESIWPRKSAPLTFEEREDLSEALSNLGLGGFGQGNPARAHFLYEQALRICPENYRAVNNMALLFWNDRSKNKTVQTFQHAILLNPDFEGAYINLGMAYWDFGDLLNAAQTFRDPHVRKNPTALLYLQIVLHYMCAWGDRDYMSPFVVPKGMAIDPHVALHLPLSAEVQRDMATLRAETVERRVQEWGTESHGDFGDHPRGRDLMPGRYFAQHNRTHLEVFCFALKTDDSEPQQAIMEGADHFIDLSPFPDTTAAHMIAEQEIDVLIDLNGWTSGSRTEILALRPAPLQLHYLGFAGTMGASFLPYMIADRIVAAPEFQRFFREKLLLMPWAYQVNDHQTGVPNLQILPPGSSRDAIRRVYGLPRNSTVFCNFQTLRKIDAEIFGVWMNTLSFVANGVLWLWRGGGGGDTAETNLKTAAQTLGIDSTRLYFADSLKKEEHMVRLTLCDLFLDTQLYNAHTTATDALWAGVPVLTIPGDHMSSRVAASLSLAAGIEETVVHSVLDYERQAVALGRDPERLWQLRRKLFALRRTSPLFNTMAWQRTMEAGLLMLWEAESTMGKQFHILPASTHFDWNGMDSAPTLSSPSSSPSPLTEAFSKHMLQLAQDEKVAADRLLHRAWNRIHLVETMQQNVARIRSLSHKEEESGGIAARLLLLQDDLRRENCQNTVVLEGGSGIMSFVTAKTQAEQAASRWMCRTHVLWAHAVALKVLSARVNSLRNEMVVLTSAPWTFGKTWIWGAHEPNAPKLAGNDGTTVDCVVIHRWFFNEASTAAEVQKLLIALYESFPTSAIVFF